MWDLDAALEQRNRSKVAPAGCPCDKTPVQQGHCRNANAYVTSTYGARERRSRENKVAPDRILEKSRHTPWLAEEVLKRLVGNKTNTFERFFGAAACQAICPPYPQNLPCLPILFTPKLVAVGESGE